MRLFLFTAFVIYGGMHAYAFHRARAALLFGMPAGSALAVFMLVMAAGPFLVRVLEQSEYELAARLFSVIAYFWMGLLFLFFCVSITMEASNIILKVGGSVTGYALTMPPKPSFLAAAGVAIVICIYGYFSALHVTTERVIIETAKLPEGMDRFRIVQISDVHLGLIVRDKRLKKIVDAVMLEKPDMLVSSGDLVDAQINHLNGLAELLRRIKAPYGKYAVTGNHEFYAGLTQAISFTESAGFTVLRNETVHDNPALTIAGVDDPAAIPLNSHSTLPETSLFSGGPRGKFTLLLKHRPSLDDKAVELFDLQLSGHTHRGQIFPFNYAVKQVYPLIAGTFTAGTKSLLHVSRGSGTWGPPVRFLSPPEITVIDLIRKR